MKTALILAAALVICWVIWLNDPITRDNRETAARAYQSDVYRRQAQADFDQQQYFETRAITTPINAGLIVIATTAGVVVVIGLGAVLVLRAFRGAIMVWPDNAGRLPYAIGQLTGERQDNALAAFHYAQLERAKHPTPPHVYSPHLSYRNDQNGLLAPLGDAENHGERPPVPDFQQLWRRGLVGNNQDLLLGLDADSATYEGIYGTWRDLYSSAILGVQGSGKTTTARFLAAQSALCGAKFIVCDPDGENDQGVAYDQTLTYALAPLSQLYLAEPAATEGAIIHNIRYARETMRKRINGESTDEWPLIVWFDEFNALMRSKAVASELGPLLEEIATRGRKRNVFSALLMHQAQASRAGGSELRDVLASAYVHRVKRRIAAMVLGVSASELVETTHLHDGEALLYRTRGDMSHVLIPWTTRADIEQVAAKLRGQTFAGYATMVPPPELGVEEQLDLSAGVLTNDAQYWAESNITTVDGSVLRASDLYRDYVKWCVERELEPLNQTAFGLGLRRVGYTKRRGQTGQIEYVNVAYRTAQEY